jgi:hypothetical protein
VKRTGAIFSFAPLIFFRLKHLFTFFLDSPTGTD